jgi:hypothetical protein
VELLTDVGFDFAENDDIRYGAFRELVEIAARAGKEKAEEIFTGIRVRIAKDDEPLPKRVLNAFRSCAILKKQSSEEPDWWRDSYRPLLMKAMELIKSNEDDYSIWEAQKKRFETDDREISI